MKRHFVGLALMSAFVSPQIALSQTSAPTPAPVGNNPLQSGLYFEGMLGVNVADDLDLENQDNGLEAVAEQNAGFLGGLTLGYNLPQGPLNIRVEGEAAVRVNTVDEIEDNGALIVLENADVSSGTFMANAHLDYYIIPNFALTVGAGLGFTNVALDLAVIDDSATGFAYQGRAGARYSLDRNSTITLAYTYLAASELEVEGEAGEDFEFDYASHGFTLGYAFHF